MTKGTNRIKDYQIYAILKHIGGPKTKKKKDTKYQNLLRDKHYLDFIHCKLAGYPSIPTLCQHSCRPAAWMRKVPLGKSRMVNKSLKAMY